MIYKLTDVDEVIARLDNDFNINKADYINRIPQWVYQCLGNLHIHLGLVPAIHIANVENNQAELPDDIEWLTAIEYNGTRLTKASKTSVKFSTSPAVKDYIAVAAANDSYTIIEDTSNVTIDEALNSMNLDLQSIYLRDSSYIKSLTDSTDNYVLLPNGKIDTSFKSGIVYIHYYKFPVYYSELIGSLCPKVPDHEAILEALTWYILMSILQRGYKHPVYSLNSNSFVTNPYLMYRKIRLNAKNKSADEDRDTGRLIDAMWKSSMYNVIAKPL